MIVVTDFLIGNQVTGVALGLAYLHEKGVVHSDLKSVRIVNFGFLTFL